MKRKYVNKCKYCGNKTNNKDTCHNCGLKLELVRKLVKMGEPYRNARKNE